MKKMNKKEELMTGILCGAMAWGALASGFMMAAVSATMIKKAVKKGEK